MRTHIQCDRKERERRRLRAGRMFARGASQAVVARHFGVTTATTHEWYHTWKKNKKNGLKSKGPPGFPSQYTEKKKKELKKIILKGPIAYGYTTDFWTIERIRAVAHKKLHVTLATNRTWQTIISLGFSVQKPERRAKERNEKAITEWKQTEFPKLKKMGSKTPLLRGVSR